MAVVRPLADIMQECRSGRKTGALFVSIAGKSENLIRFFFRDGEICSISFGPVKDKECADIIDCYDFEKVVYFDGMKSPTICKDLPPTEAIIEKVRSCGKQVEVSNR